MQSSEVSDFKMTTEDVPADSLIIDPDSETGVDVEGARTSCGEIEISDFQLSSISIGSQLQIIDQDLTVSLGKPTLKVKALKNGNLEQVALVLSNEGNKILTTNNRELILKTPSGQTAGIKIHFSEKIMIEANKNYLLKLNIDPEGQIVTNPSKCIFKPVIKNAEMVLE